MSATGAVGTRQPVPALPRPQRVRADPSLAYHRAEVVGGGPVGLLHPDLHGLRGR
jgi:hypothetical protein